MNGIHMNHRNRRIVAAAALTAVSLPYAGVAADFGPANPFYAPSTLPFRAPPFDLPASMRAVVESRSDVSFDTAEPLFRFGDGIV